MKRVFGLALLALGVSSAHALVLDDFTTGFASASTSVGANYSVAAAGVPGGVRAINHNFSDNPKGRSILTEVNDTFPGNMFIEAGSGVDGDVDIYWAGDVTDSSYGYDFGSFAGLGGADLSAKTGFKVTYIDNDQDSTGLVMRVVDTDGDVSVFSGTMLAAGDGMAVVDFADFSGSADFDSLDGVHMKIVLPDGNDITLTQFEAVPEPATLAVLGLGLAAFARRRKSA